jgi:hypothetical protein
MAKYRMVGFDADDPIWRSEGYLPAAHAGFEAMRGCCSRDPAARWARLLRALQ